MQDHIILNSAEKTEDLGSKIGEYFQENLVIFLKGDLGSGKTTFCRGLIHGQGYLGRIKSPTYSIIEIYSTQKHTILHADFYRIKDPEELIFLGLDEFQTSHSLWLIEWPEKVSEYLPSPDLILSFNALSDATHCLSWQAITQKSQKIADFLAKLAEVSNNN